MGGGMGAKWIYSEDENTLRKTVPPGSAPGKLFSYLDFFKNLEIEKSISALLWGGNPQTQPAAD